MKVNYLLYKHKQTGELAEIQKADGFYKLKIWNGDPDAEYIEDNLDTRENVKKFLSLDCVKAIDETEFNKYELV